MKKIFYISIVLLFVSNVSLAQSKTYTTSGFEFIFSFADLKQNGSETSTELRFSPVLNLQTMFNHDLSDKFGLFTGIAMRNVGYITKDYIDPSNNQTFKKMFRSYNVGVPVGIKIGNLNSLFFYGGYEFELGVHYKEKTYDSGDKVSKTTGWFSDRQELLQHSLMVGIQFPYGTNLKFKYYLSNFHNTDFTNSAGIKPYGQLNSNIMYVSLNFFLFRNAKVDIYSPNTGI